MATADVKGHDYHLVDPSPWPAVGATAAFITTVGGVLYMHSMPYGTPILLIGLLGVAYTMFMWWRDVIREAVHEGHHTPVVQLHLRYGMVLFIASEVMFFVAWFWAFFGAALFPNVNIDHQWPPPGIEPFDPWHLPFLNTVILLASGTTLTWAHHALQHDDRKGMVQGLVLTIVLGALFTAVQAYEYSHAAFGFKDGIYASTFFMATGFHGAHVLIGTIFLIVTLGRTLAGHFTSTHHFGFEAAAWYWHFVDVVWLFLFFCIYVWGSAGAAPAAGH